MAVTVNVKITNPLLIPLVSAETVDPIVRRLFATVAVGVLKYPALQETWTPLREHERVHVTA